MRYERIGSVIERWHTEDAPVVIEAAVLMKDHQNDTVFAQLKCRNIGDGVITALTVSVQPLDGNEQPLGEAVIYTYEGIALAWEQTCGQKVPVVLPDNATADMDVKVVSAVYESGYVWTADASAAWAAIPSIDARDEEEAAQVSSRRMPRWIVPTAIAVAVIVLFGVFWKPVFYAAGSVLFSVEEYASAAAVFETIADFGNAEERMVDARVQEACNLLRRYDYTGAVACVGAEHANELLCDTATASLYLVGEWYDAGGAYYFAMDDEGGVRYNLPASAAAVGVYSIENGMFLRADEDGTAIPLWLFHVVSGDELQIDHRNGQIYTLYRYG